MRTRILAHVSDLHFGRGAAHDRRAASICDTLLARGVDHVVVSGNVTHRGRAQQLEQFACAFAPFASSGRLTVVPGNHDRLGDDVSAPLRGGERVMVTRTPGLHLVRYDSTGPHNRSWLADHGVLDRDALEEIVHAFDDAGPDAVAALVLHHHLLPLPHDSRAERIASWLGLASGAELELGRELLARLRGRCDLVLHGHRHDPGAAIHFPADRRPISLFNAGCTPQLGQVRLFVHGRGVLFDRPVWVRTNVAVDRSAQPPRAVAGPDRHVPVGPPP